MTGPLPYLVMYAACLLAGMAIGIWLEHWPFLIRHAVAFAVGSFLGYNLYDLFGLGYPA